MLNSLLVSTAVVSLIAALAVILIVVAISIVITHFMKKPPTAENQDKTSFFTKIKPYSKYIIVSALLMIAALAWIIALCFENSSMIGMYIFLYICICAVIVAFAIGIYKANIQLKQKQAIEANRHIMSVSVLGTRMGMETRILATYNFTIYSLLVKYDDNTQEVVECKSGSEEFKKYAPYIVPTDNNNKI